MMHIRKAHTLWGETLRPGMQVIDATAGNGHDTLVLAKYVLTETAGWLWTFDIQEVALHKTRALLEKNLPPALLQRITFLHHSHATFPKGLPPIDLIVYNLGYLPGGDHQVTTETETTLQSLQEALRHLAPQGHISLTLYPGHSEGAREKVAVEKFLYNLPPLYTVEIYPSNDRPHSPVFLYISKKSNLSCGKVRQD